MVRAWYASGSAMMPKEFWLANHLVLSISYVGIEGCSCTKYSFFIKPTVLESSSESIRVNTELLCAEWIVLPYKQTDTSWYQIAKVSFSLTWRVITTPKNTKIPQLSPLLEPKPQNINFDTLNRYLSLIFFYKILYILYWGIRAEAEWIWVLRLVIWPSCRTTTFWLLYMMNCDL